MTENIIDTIKKIEEKPGGVLIIPGIGNVRYGNGKAYFNNGLDVLLAKIKQEEELRAIPSFVGKYMEPIHLEILIGKYMVTPNNGRKKASLTFLPKDFFTKIDKSVFLEINNGHLGLITPEEWGVLPKETFSQLVKADKLRYISDESVEFLTKNLNLDSITTLNKFSNEAIYGKFEKVMNILNYFYKAGKLEYLAKEAVRTINPEIIKKLPVGYLLPIAKHLTKKQIGKINDKQFDAIKNEINPEVISGLNLDIISKNEDFLKNLTPEQAENLSERQIEAIKTNGKFDILPDNVLSIIANKIEGKLEELEADSLTRIAKSKNEDIPVPDSKPRLDGFSADVDFKGTITKESDFEAAINKILENEDWSGLGDYCLFQSESNDQKLTIYKVLNKKIEEKVNDNIYALVDKIQLLLTAIPLAPNEEELYNIYEEFKGTINLFIEKSPTTVDEYFTKFDLYSSLLANKGLKKEFRKMISEKQESLMTVDFKNKFFKNPERTLDNFTKEKIVDVYLKRLSLLIEEGVDLKKFEKELSPSESRNLNENGINFNDCLLKIKEYEPNLENKIRQVVGDGLKVITRATSAYFAAKAAAKNNSTAVKVAAGAGAAYMGYEMYKVAKNAKQIEEYSKPAIRKLIHKDEKEEKINKTPYKFGWVSFGSSKKPKKNISDFTKEEKKEARVTWENLVNEELEKQLNNLKEEEKKFKYKKISESWEKNSKDKSDLENKQERLIENDNRIRKKALELAKDKKIDKLLETYPDFKKKSVISRIKDTLSQISNGFAEGVLDAINKYKGDAFKESANEEKNEKEIVISEASCRIFMDEMSKINEEYEKGLTKVEHRKYQRLASINKNDKEKFGEFKENTRKNKLHIDDEKRKLFKIEFKPEEPKEDKKPNKNKNNSMFFDDFEIELTDEDVMGHSNYNDYPSQTNKSIFAQADENTKYLNSNEENDNHSHRKALEEQQQIEIPKSPYDNF